MILFNIMFTLVPLMMIAILGYTIITGILRWNKNNHSPRLTVPATIVAKRSYRARNNNMATNSSYYVTFQFESGDRLELKMAGNEFGLLVEGDRGELTFQGTRYLDFKRT